MEGSLSKDTLRGAQGILPWKILRPSQCVAIMSHLFKLGDLTEPPRPQDSPQLRPKKFEKNVLNLMGWGGSWKKSLPWGSYGHILELKFCWTHLVLFSFVGNSLFRSPYSCRCYLWFVWLFCVCPHACLLGSWSGMYLPCGWGHKCRTTVDGRVRSS